MNKQKRQSGFAHLAILTVIVTVSLIGALGFIYYQNFIQKKDGVSKVDTNDKTNDNKSDEIDKYEGWQTYTNTDFGYSIKYPKGWTYSEYQDHPTKPVHHTFTSSNQNTYITVDSYNSELSPKTFFESVITDVTVLDSRQTEINEHQTYYARYGFGERIARYYYVKNGSEITTISLMEKDEFGTDNTGYVDQFNLVASSIKFS